mmetsp:Transcript_34994/g.77847  ORF Transcript_34994/g.77847 Transcript_34994/m.77847 type:complete len:259 (+) Transcript_34994:1261-2037(+)
MLACLLLEWTFHHVLTRSLSRHPAHHIRLKHPHTQTSSSVGDPQASNIKISISLSSFNKSQLPPSCQAIKSRLLHLYRAKSPLFHINRMNGVSSYFSATNHTVAFWCLRQVQRASCFLDTSANSCRVYYRHNRLTSSTQVGSEPWQRSSPTCTGSHTFSHICIPWHVALFVVINPLHTIRMGVAPFLSNQASIPHMLPCKGKGVSYAARQQPWATLLPTCSSSSSSGRHGPRIAQVFPYFSELYQITSLHTLPRPCST